MSPVGRPAVGAGLVFLAAVGFSIKSVLIKVAYGEGASPTTLFALRQLFSVPFFVILALWSHRADHSALPTPTRRDWAHLVGLGLLGYYLAAFLDFVGLSYISAGLERLILFLYPTVVVLLSAWWLRERIRRRQAVALALSYVGIGLVFAAQIRLTGSSRALWIGSGLVFTSAVVYSVYLIGSSRVVHRFGAIRFTTGSMLVATAAGLTQFFAAHTVDDLRLPGRVYVLAFVMALFATVIPTLMMAEGLRRIGANQAALVGTIGPVVTMVLGAVFLGEQFGPVQIAGAGLVLAGVLMVSVRSG